MRTKALMGAGFVAAVLAVGACSSSGGDGDAASSRAGGGGAEATDADSPPPSVDLATARTPEHFDAVLEAFGELGEVRSRRVDTEDVTGQVVDLEARLASTRTSVDRLRELLASSGGVADLLSVEQALAQREAEAEALVTQLNALRARVDLATITLHVAESAAAAKTEVSDDIPGFLAGLRTGAAAFGNAALLFVTVVGFALPFLALAAVVGAPVWYFTRRPRLAAGA